MKKLKELWQRNKVLIVLLFILIICLIAILIVCVSFFLGGNKSVYGDRLKDLDKHPITEVFKSEYIASLEAEDLIDDVSFTTSGGRVIYIRIKFKQDTSLDEAKNKAVDSLSKFSEDILNYYDIDFTLITDASENSEGFKIMGARNASGSELSWGNNTKVESEVEK